MGGGFHGGFGNTFGSKVAVGSISFMNKDDKYYKNIQNRTDIDTNQVIDIIGHGTTNTFEIMNNDKKMEISSRELAKLLKSSKKKLKKGIRLLSCDTGRDLKGFAQNLANKLGVTVYAPNNLIWAYPTGSHVIAPRDLKNPNQPDLSKLGKFIKFIPGGNKKNGK